MKLNAKSNTSSTGGSSSITDKIREVAAGRGERGAQEVTKSDRDFPLSGGNSSTVTDTRGAGYGSTPSEGYGSTGAGASGLGRDAALGGAAAGGADIAEHEHRRDVGDIIDPTAGATTGTTTGATGTSHLGRDAALGGAAVGGAGLAEHEHRRDVGDTTDPTASTTTGTTGTSHLGRDAALGGAAVGGADLAEHEHRRDMGDATSNTTGATTGTTTGSTTGLGSGSGAEGWDHDHSQPHAFEGDPCGPGAEPAGPRFIEGPHITDTANRLDPNASTTGAHTHGSSTTGIGLGSSTGTGLETTTGQENTTGAHTGRDAALAGGAGVAGVGAYEEGRHHDAVSTGTDPTFTGPVHKSSLLNKLDPRVKQDTTSTQGAAGVEGPGTTDRSGHGYQTEDVGGMAGARVVAPYEIEKQDHQPGRAAAGGAALGTAGYEAEKHDATGGSSQYGGLEPLDHKHHDPAEPSSIANTGSSEYAGLHHGNIDDSSKHHKHPEKEHHAEKGHEKKSGGIFGFLHKDKSDKDTSGSESHHHGDAAEAGAAGAGSADVVEHEKHHHERNRLHKVLHVTIVTNNGCILTYLRTLQQA